MQEIERNDLSKIAHEGSSVELPGAPSLELVADDYIDDLEALGITPEQRDEFLANLWSMMAGMVQLGFSYDLCGQILDGFENVTETAEDQVELPSSKRR